MADGRIDDIEGRIRDLEARVAGLSEESATVRGSLADLTGDRRLVDGESEDAAADDGETGDAGTDDNDVAADREIVMAPPKGASQAAVDAAVDSVEGARDREERLVVRGRRT